MMAAMAFLMPPSGALVSMTLVTVFFLRLILGEEAFLTVQLGEPYRDYLRAVPRLFPRLRMILSPAASPGASRTGLPSVLTEINPIGVFLPWPSSRGAITTG